METRLHAQPKAAPPPSFTLVRGGVLQRKCACGGSAGVMSECDNCSSKKLSLQRSAATLETPNSVSPYDSRFSDHLHGTRIPMASERRLGHAFNRLSITPIQRETAQARLVVGQPGDRFELEADLIANHVMQTDESPAESSARFGSPSTYDSIQRVPNDADSEQGNEASDDDRGGAEGGAADIAVALLEEDDLGGIASATTDSSAQSAATEPAPAEKDQAGTIQAHERGDQTFTLSSNDEKGINSLRGSGQPLAGPHRAFFEQRFGHDFGDVRIHAGPKAGQLAHAVRAKAFTVGSDIAFGAGYYQPTLPTGRWLLAHELTHVLQQRSSAIQQPSSNINVQENARRRVQGGFFKNLWSGIKKGVSAVWGGIKTAATKTWQGIKWGAGKLWKGIKAVGKWGWNVLKAGAALAWSQVVNTPGRIWRLIKHLGSGVAGVGKWLWEGLKLAWHLDFKGLGAWLLEGLLSGTAWVLRLAAKLIDIAGFGEVWDLVFQIIKVNTRTLTSTEKTEAQKTFKNSISYWQVRIDQFSLISKIGALFSGSSGMGVTTFHTVNFDRKIQATPGSNDMHWLTHELTHVSQYEHVGTQYLGEAVYGQASKAGYNYDPAVLWRPATNVSPNMAAKHFNQFNREQQAEIAADYYFSIFNQSVTHQDGLTFVPVTGEYEPVIDELRNGNI